ncbi:MAG: DUF6463 family protein [Tannerellaceae bacterium]|nr:DUF6463 family protein [Tannerellaceae bacterium]
MANKRSIKLWQLSGILMLLTGIIHTMLAILLGGEHFAAIISDGIWNGIGGNIVRALSLWFLVCGVFCMFLGAMMHCYIKKVGEPLPLWLGYGLLILSAPGCAVDPASGFWLIPPQAAIIILANWRR